MDVLTDHSKIDLTSANAYVEAAVAIYVLSLWAIRDHFGGFGRRGVVLPISCLTLIAAAFVGAQPWTNAIILMINMVCALNCRKRNKKCYGRQIMPPLYHFMTIEGFLSFQIALCSA